MVLFDMDGLLLDTERVCLECCVELGNQYDLPDLTEVFIQMIGLRGAEGRSILEGGLKGHVDHDTFVTRWDAMIAARLVQEVPVKSGVLTLLEGLRVSGIKSAVATSTRTGIARMHLETAKLLDFFDEVIGGDMVEKGKPHPEIYLTAADALGVSATECVVFEDSEPGVRAGIAASACVVQIPDIKQPSAELIALGHIIAPDILEGARRVGLFQ